MKSRTKIIVVGIALLGLCVPVAQASAPPVPAQVFAQPQGRVDNVRWNRDGTTMTVTYDLTSTDANAVFQVTLKVSIDGSPFKAVTLTGDIGEKVTPGTGKKIVWQSGRDTENQDYELFKFDVVALATLLKEVKTDPPVLGRPAAAPDLRGNWRGVYANSASAELLIDRQDGEMFMGTLRVAMKKGDPPTEISVEGKIAAQSVEIRELKVVEPGKINNWRLGSGSGTLQADSQQMVGKGRDSGSTYQWSFTRGAAGDTTAPAAAAAPPRTPPAAAPTSPSSQMPASSDLSGTWTGTYSGFPAELALTITGGSGAFFTGTLRVTTSRGRAPTEVSVEILVKGETITLRETRVVAKGAASSWNLGAATGILQPDNRLMSGSGKDSGRSYKWSFMKQ